ncbi:MAG: hypothetical protein Roseis2KO_31020 [Roseivirga sp.]
MAYLKRRAYYENSKRQTDGVSRILQILNAFGAEEGDEQGVEFFFDTDCEPKAKSLSAQLTQLGYEVCGIHEINGKYSLSGCTPPIKMTDSGMMEWCDLMGDLGYENDCAFDGWGTLIHLDSPIDPSDLENL